MTTEESLYTPGTVITDRFTVIQLLGTGGMGFVLLVEDSEEGNRKALKLLYHDAARDEILLERFHTEIEIVCTLSHPNLVKGFGHGVSEHGHHFFIMEYVEGKSLQGRLDQAKDSKIPFEEQLQIVSAVCSALHHTHTHPNRIAHRDLKPANILIAESGEVKVTDFGVAKLMIDDRKLTRPAEAIGSAIYMAPENFEAQTVDPRADIYSLGIIAYELATGKPPFVAQSAERLMFMHAGFPLPEFPEDSNAPVWYQQVIEQATAKERNERFQSMKEFQEALLPGLSTWRKYLIPLVLIVGSVLVLVAARFLASNLR